MKDNKITLTESECSEKTNHLLVASSKGAVQMQGLPVILSKDQPNGKRDLFGEQSNSTSCANQDLPLVKDLMEKEISDLKKENASLEEKNEEYSKESKLLHSKIDDLSYENYNLTQENRVLTYSLDQEKNRGSVLKGLWHRYFPKFNDVSSLYNYITHLEKTNNQIDRDIRTLQDSKRILESKNSSLELDKNKALQDIKILKSNMVSTENFLTNECQALRVKNNILERDVKIFQEQANAGQEQVNALQQKLYVATSRLRGVNTNSVLGGGGSRSDQLIKQFAALKPKLHETSSHILKGWRDQGTELSYRSEEFSKIKSVLSDRVFGDGMTHYGKNKTQVAQESDSIMNAIEDIIQDFKPTTMVIDKIKYEVQVALLRSKGIDLSEAANHQYVENQVQQICLDLSSICNSNVTYPARSEIKKFVEEGLSIVRDVINDDQSGELFIPKYADDFNVNNHESRDPSGRVLMTICAGYRIGETVLVKADVVTYELPKDCLHQPSANVKYDHLEGSDSRGKMEVYQSANSSTDQADNQDNQSEVEQSQSHITESSNTQNKQDEAINTGEVESIPEDTANQELTGLSNKDEHKPD
jgi:hypothetical protein